MGGRRATTARGVARCRRDEHRPVAATRRSAGRQDPFPYPTMPLPITTGHPTLFITKAAFERVGLVRSAIDERLGLTDEEFRVEGGLVVIGPIHDDEGFEALMADLEQLGLAYFDDYFELSGNWPEWLAVYAAGGA